MKIDENECYRTDFPAKACWNDFYFPKQNQTTESNFPTGGGERVDKSSESKNDHETGGGKPKRRKLDSDVKLLQLKEGIQICDQKQIIEHLRERERPPFESII